MRTLIFSTLISLLTAGLSLAESEKFHIEGDTLFYNTMDIEENDYVSIRDADIFRTLLFQNPEIVRVNLYSYGGLLSAGLEIGRVLSDFNIDTEVTKECSSACVPIFLAGQNRELKPGGLIGFHRPEWGVESMQDYYEDNRGSEGWSDPFAFASWVQTDLLGTAGLIYTSYADAGVDVKFVAESLKTPADSMWYPDRQELIDAGVIHGSGMAFIKPRMRPLQPKAPELMTEVELSLLEE